MWGVYIPHFDQMSVKILVLWVLYRYRCTDEGEISPHGCNVSSLRGEKSQNRPLSKLNNRRFALRAMLPVKHVFNSHKDSV